MRSLIQLAGRIQRHRRRPPNEPNMLLLDIPIKYYLRAKADQPVYIKPGFESDHPTRPFRLSTYWLHELLKPEEYQTPSAIPRIAPRPTNRRDHKSSLTDLEQARMEASMLPGGPIVRDSRGRLNRPADLGRDEAAPGWEYARTMLTAILQQAQPFRDSSDIRTTNLVFLPDEEESRLVLHRIEDNHSSYSKKLYIPVEDSLCQTFPLNKGDCIGNWAEFDLIDLLREHSESLNIPLRHCAEKLATAEVTASEQGWNWNPQTGFSIKH